MFNFKRKEKDENPGDFQLDGVVKNHFDNLRDNAIAINEPSSRDIEDIINNNFFVFTRDLFEDYKYYYKPEMIKSSNRFHNAMEKMYENGCINDGKWHDIDLDSPNYVALVRFIEDGRKDQFGRLIRRYEGSIIPKEKRNSTILLSFLENGLDNLKRKSNNYGYGFVDIQIGDNKEIEQIFFDDQQCMTEKSNKVETECIVVVNENGTIEIKSDLLSKLINEGTINLSSVKVVPVNPISKK